MLHESPLVVILATKLHSMASKLKVHKFDFELCDCAVLFPGHQCGFLTCSLHSTAEYY